MCGTAGRFDDGLRFVNKAIAVASSQDSQWCLAELHRIKGELMLAHGELTSSPALKPQSPLRASKAPSRGNSAPPSAMPASSILRVGLPRVKSFSHRFMAGSPKGLTSLTG